MYESHAGGGGVGQRVNGSENAKIKMANEKRAHAKQRRKKKCHEEIIEDVKLRTEKRKISKPSHVRLHCFATPRKAPEMCVAFFFLFASGHFNSSSFTHFE